MGVASRYWKLVRIDAAGNRKIEEIAPAKAFFLASFPELTAQNELPDASIQRQLWQWMREAAEDVRPLAKRCLQCYISSQIEQACQQLAAQFGIEHGFTYKDLLPFVLDDDGRRPRSNQSPPNSSSYKSLLNEILDSFDPEQSTLATWATRRVKHHKELNAFLLECGVYLVSDWAILNDTTSKQLQRIFSEFHRLTPHEIEQARELLESYHAIYRAQRLQQRQAGKKGQCLPPTPEQLQQIIQHLSTRTNKRLSPTTAIAQLQTIASRLRQYRIHVRSGTLPTESIDAPASGTSPDRNPFLEFSDRQDATDEQSEFLSHYRQQFLICLDRVLAQVIQAQVTKLQRKNPQKAEKFLTALELFHCRGQSMTEIAPIVNLQAQFQVSRLLNLKAFRADIRQQLLVELRDRVLDQAKAYTDPERLQFLSQQIEEALDEQISKLMQAAATQASTATITKHQITSSLFARRLCRHLDTRRKQP